jgi:hypothetical protein
MMLTRYRLERLLLPSRTWHRAFGRDKPQLVECDVTHSFDICAHHGRLLEQTVPENLVRAI